MSDRKAAIVIGAGDATGGEARGFGSDARDEAQVIDLFSTVECEVGPVEVFVFNIGANVNFPIAEIVCVH